MEGSKSFFGGSRVQPRTAHLGRKRSILSPTNHPSVEYHDFHEAPIERSLRMMDLDLPTFGEMTPTQVNAHVVGRQVSFSKGTTPLDHTPRMYNLRLTSDSR